MLSLKCDNCYAEMTINGIGDLVCPYCGTKSSFSDSELTEYRAFRKRFLAYIEAVADGGLKSSDTEALWRITDSVTFETASGQKITINYLYHSKYDGVEMYMARNTNIFIFGRHDGDKLEKMIDNISQITFPQADMNKLPETIPQFRGQYKLADGRYLLVLNRGEDYYSLGMFGNLPYEHTAWVISRLENIACLLEYNEVVHGGLAIDAVFINPKTHQAALYGNWWLAGKMTDANKTKDLKGLREVAQKLLKPYNNIPAMLKDFLKNSPAADAFSDFKLWDEVIEKGLGGRHFHKLNLPKGA